MSTWTSRERLRCTLRREEPDRVPRCEICFWPETIARWHEEGLPADQTAEQLFDLDVLPLFSADLSLRLPTEIIEECDEWQMVRDSNGVVHKSWKDSYATPCEVDTLIKTRADWEKLRERLLFSEDRVASDLSQQIAAAQTVGRLAIVSPVEPIWWALRTLGMERSLMALGEDPAWVAEMIATQARQSLALIEHLAALPAKPDAIWYFSDLCYRNGMLFSPRAYRELMQDWHRQIADLCHAHDLFLLLHCDGDVSQFLPLVIESGFDAIQPLEARAGNDVRVYKPLYGDRITFFGNMNMDVYATGDREAVREEVVSKITAAKTGGGYIHHSDHSVPPTVSFETYRYAQDLAREYGE